MSQGKPQPDRYLNVAPGSTVVVRDEEWLVTAVERVGNAYTYDHGTDMRTAYAEFESRLRGQVPDENRGSPND